MIKPVTIQMIIASVRVGRRADTVAGWLKTILAHHPEIKLEVLDLKEWQMPYYAEKTTPSTIKGQYENEMARKWAQKVARGDGYIMVTPEYNHSFPASLKNVLDYLYEEWNNKPVAFVSYGASSGGIRAVEQLRAVVSELGMIAIRSEVNIPYARFAFNESGQPNDERLGAKAESMLSQLVTWVRATELVRNNI